MQNVDILNTAIVRRELCPSIFFGNTVKYLLEILNGICLKYCEIFQWNTVKQLTSKQYSEGQVLRFFWILPAHQNYSLLLFSPFCLLFGLFSLAVVSFILLFLSIFSNMWLESMWCDRTQGTPGNFQYWVLSWGWGNKRMNKWICNAL